MQNTLVHTRSIGMLRIIIPAKNEAARIRSTLVAYCEHFGSFANVLVVANGCTDRTVEVVNELRREYANLSLLVVDAGIGKGGAVRAGLTIGDEPYIAFADADGSATADQVGRLLDFCVERDVAGAIGSRWMRGSTISRRQPLKRRIASRALNTFVRLMFGLPYLDTQCGAKVFARSAIDRVLEKLEIANFAFDIDLLFALRNLNCEVVEVPICWSDVPEYSQVRVLKNGSSMFWALVRLWIRHSPLRGLPFLDMLARSSVIPVKSGLKVLVLVTRERQGLQRIVAEFERQGHETTTFDLGNPAKFASFVRWYLTFGHSSYDIIVDSTNGFFGRLISFSAKPKIGSKSLAGLHPSTTADLVEGTAQRCGYSALLWRQESGGWILSSSLVSSALLEQV